MAVRGSEFKSPVLPARGQQQSRVSFPPPHPVDSASRKSLHLSQPPAVPNTLSHPDLPIPPELPYPSEAYPIGYNLTAAGFFACFGWCRKFVPGKNDALKVFSYEIFPKSPLSGVRGSLQGPQSSSAQARFFLEVRGSQRWQQSSSVDVSSDVHTTGYSRPVDTSLGVRGSLKRQQSSSILARLSPGVRGSQRWRQSSSVDVSSDVHTTGYSRPVDTSLGVRGSLKRQQSSSIIAQLSPGVRGSQRWQQSSSVDVSSDVHTTGYSRPVDTSLGVRGSLKRQQSSSILAWLPLGVKGSQRWRQSSSVKPTFSGIENGFKRSASDRTMESTRKYILNQSKMVSSTTS